MMEKQHEQQHQGRVNAEHVGISEEIVLPQEKAHTDKEV